MKKSLSGLKIINGARDRIEGVDCSGTSGNTGGSGGGPVYITSGKKWCVILKIQASFLVAGPRKFINIAIEF